MGSAADHLLPSRDRKCILPNACATPRGNHLPPFLILPDCSKSGDRELFVHCEVQSYRYLVCNLRYLAVKAILILLRCYNKLVPDLAVAVWESCARAVRTEVDDDMIGGTVYRLV